MFVTASVTVSNGNGGSLLLSNDGLVGYSANGPVTVNRFNATVFFNLTGLNPLQSTTTHEFARRNLSAGTGSTV
jgi:hypothetical protein